MDFIVVSREEIEHGLLVRQPHVIISISDPRSRTPRIRETGLCRGILRLRFHDAEPVENFTFPENIRIMTPKHAKAVWRFVLQHVAEISTIVVHCEQGMSRSPAVAAAICLGLGQDNSRFFEEFQPNQHVYRLVLAESPLDSADGDLGE